MRDAALGAIGVQEIAAGDAQPRLQRTGVVVDAGVNDLAVARAGVHAEMALALQDDHFPAAARKRPGRRQADDSRTDDDAIDVVQYRLPAGLDRGRRGDKSVHIGARGGEARHQADGHAGAARVQRPAVEIESFDSRP